MKSGNILNGKLNKIGSLSVFTYEGAINAYKLFVRRYYDDISWSACDVLIKAADDLHALGFTYDEIEGFEIEVLKEGVTK